MHILPTYTCIAPRLNRLEVSGRASEELLIGGTMDAADVAGRDLTLVIIVNSANLDAKSGLPPSLRPTDRQTEANIREQLDAARILRRLLKTLLGCGGPENHVTRRFWQPSNPISEKWRGYQYIRKIPGAPA